MKFKDIESVLKEAPKIVNPKIKEILDSFVDSKTKKLVNYQINAGGKRLRPILTILSCLVCGGKTKDALYPAAGIEILHNYSLIIDDIIDKSSLRRGKPTVWSKFGRSIAQCIGIDYSAAVFQAANKSKHSTQISEIFAKAIKTVVDGEILDILFEQSGREDEPYVVQSRYSKITEKDYFRMISKKTASLIQACCETGGVCADAKKEKLKALGDYGFNLGIAFQIKDDILDIFGREQKFGKKIGHDIEERKLGNIIILCAMEEFSLKEKKKMLVLMKKKELKDKEIQDVIKMIEKTQARKRALKLGEKYIRKAQSALEILPQNNWNNLLKAFTDFTIQREK